MNSVERNAEIAHELQSMRNLLRLAQHLITNAVIPPRGTQDWCEATERFLRESNERAQRRLAAAKEPA
jgi:hypothetical protein